MSGGSFDYMYSRIEDTYSGFMEDDEMNEMIKDLCHVLYELEWYKSGDTCKETYKKHMEKFKKKWFGTRDEQLRKRIIDKLNNLTNELGESND